MKKETDQNSWTRLISRFAEKTILVVGDVMLDEYLWGEVERISPEAPVPVVRVNKETWVPGGAANVANNIRALGGETIICGLIGTDPPGRNLTGLLKRAGIDIRGLIADKNRPTVTKSRILAGHQQVVRIDREEVSPIGTSLRDKILEKIETLSAEIDGIILEDYAKGLLGQEMIDRIIRVAERYDILLVADPNGGNIFSYRGADLVTPNRKEAVIAAGAVRSAPVDELGRILLEKWGSKAVLITLGEEGMSLFEPGRPPYRNATMAREVFDVSGAGDTVVASVTLALAAGAGIRQSVHISNCAAGVAVGKLGTAVVTETELKKALSNE